MKIVFNDKAKTEKDYELSFDGALVTIVTDDKPILKGFTTYGLYDVPIVDGSAYKTLYRQLEGKYQLSNDGSEYVPPTPPQPPVPVHSTLTVDGTDYDVIDFNGNSFEIEMSSSEATEIFENVTEFTVNGVVCENMVFLGAYYYSDTLTLVSFRQKTEIEIEMEALQMEVVANQEAICENFEAQEALSAEVSANSEAIVELYEIVIPEEE